MGHTHSWSTVTKPLPPKAVNMIDEILRGGYEARVIQYDREDPGQPVVTPQFIHFNGVGEQGKEPFHFSLFGPMPTRCKTYQAPYDRYVMMTLVVIKHYLGDQFRVDSDGRIDVEWKDVLEHMATQHHINSFKLQRF